MKRLAIAVAGLWILSLSVAQAQVRIGAEVTARGAGMHVQAPRNNRADALRTQSQQPDSVLTYLNAAAPRFAWPIPSNWGQFIMFGIGERFTMPADSAYVDSIRIRFSQISDTIDLLLVADTLYTTPQGDFHLVNGFADFAPIYSMRYVPPPSTNDTVITFYFPHVWVPKEFHVFLAPTFSSANFPAFSVMGDSEQTRTRTTENTRTGFMALVSTQSYILVLDSSLVPSGYESPTFSNLDITTYYSLDSTGSTNETQYIGLFNAMARPPQAAVSYINPITPHALIVPNPTSEMVSITGVTGIQKVAVFDVVGRCVLSRDVQEDPTFSVASLQSGNYLVNFKGNGTQYSLPLVIQR